VQLLDHDHFVQAPAMDVGDAILECPVGTAGQVVVDCPRDGGEISVMYDLCVTPSPTPVPTPDTIEATQAARSGPDCGAKLVSLATGHVLVPAMDQGEAIIVCPEGTAGWASVTCPGHGGETSVQFDLCAAVTPLPTPLPTPHPTPSPTNMPTPSPTSSPGCDSQVLDLPTGFVLAPAMELGAAVLGCPYGSSGEIAVVCPEDGGAVTLLIDGCVADTARPTQVNALGSNGSTTAVSPGCASKAIRLATGMLLAPAMDQGEATLDCPEGASGNATVTCGEAGEITLSADQCVAIHAGSGCDAREILLSTGAVQAPAMDAGDEDIDCPNSPGQARVGCPGGGGEITVLVDQCKLDVYVKSALTFSGMTKEQAMAMEHAVQEGIAIHVGALPQNVIILGYSRRLSFSGSIRRLGDILGVTIDFKVAVSEEMANEVEAELATPSPNALLRTITAVLYFDEDVAQDFADAGGSILDVTLTINEVDFEDFPTTAAPTEASLPPSTTADPTPSSADPGTATEAIMDQSGTPEIEWRAGEHSEDCHSTCSAIGKSCYLGVETDGVLDTWPTTREEMKMVVAEAGLDCAVSSQPRCDMADTPRVTGTKCYFCDQAPGPQSVSISHRVEDFCASWTSFESRVCPCVAESSAEQAPVQHLPAVETSTMVLGVGAIVGGTLMLGLVYKMCCSRACRSREPEVLFPQKHFSEPEEEPTWLKPGKKAKPSVSPTRQVRSHSLPKVPTLVPV